MLFHLFDVIMVTSMLGCIAPLRNSHEYLFSTSCFRNSNANLYKSIASRPNFVTVSSIVRLAINLMLSLLHLSSKFSFSGVEFKIFTLRSWRLIKFFTMVSKSLFYCDTKRLSWIVNSYFSLSFISLKLCAFLTRSIEFDSNSFNFFRYRSTSLKLFF